MEGKFVRVDEIRHGQPEEHERERDRGNKPGGGVEDDVQVFHLAADDAGRSLQVPRNFERRAGELDQRGRPLCDHDHEDRDEENGGDPRPLGEKKRAAAGGSGLFLIGWNRAAAPGPDREQTGQTAEAEGGNRRTCPGKKKRAEDNQPTDQNPADGQSEEPARRAAPPFAVRIARPAARDAREDHDGEKNKGEKKRDREAGIEFRDRERLIENPGRAEPEQPSSYAARDDDGEEFRETKSVRTEERRGPREEVNRDPEIDEEDRGVRRGQPEEAPLRQRPLVVAKPGPVNGHEDGGEQNGERAEDQEPRLAGAFVPAAGEIDAHEGHANRDADAAGPHQREGVGRGVFHQDGGVNPRDGEDRGEQGDEDEPIQDQIAHISARQRPGIG